MITFEPIGVVHGTRREVVDDHWGAESSAIELAEAFPPDALDGIEEFSHAEVIFLLDRVPDAEIERGARHPRGNQAWPRVGIFAQRARVRPNRIAATIVRVLGREGRTLRVADLDAIDGTPVLDIKPVMAEFLPRTPLRQPQWSHELMAHYW